MVDYETVGFFFDALHGCRIALLDNSELVIVAGGVRTGDVMCILSGAYSPCALRRLRSNYWSLVCGDCYIFTRNFYKDLIFCSDAYVAQHQDSVQSFNIR